MRLCLLSLVTMCVAGCLLVPPKKEDPPGQPPGKGSQGDCTGNQVNPTDYGDISSCQLQNGIWYGYPDHDCQSNYSNQCSDAIAYDNASLTREQCIERIGCTYTSPSGVTETNPYIGGSCVGTGTHCDWISDETTCKLAGAPCHWRDAYYTVQPNTCEYAYGYIALDNITDCSDITAAAQHGSVHWQIAHATCLDRLGCSWISADGVEERGPKSDIHVAEPTPEPPGPAP